MASTNVCLLIKSNSCIISYLLNNVKTSTILMSTAVTPSAKKVILGSNQFFHYTRCIVLKRVTSLQGPSPRQRLDNTAPLKKGRSDGEPLATLCPLWPAWDLNFRPTTPETNTGQTGRLSFVAFLLEIHTIKRNFLDSFVMNRFWINWFFVITADNHGTVITHSSRTRWDFLQTLFACKLYYAHSCISLVTHTNNNTRCR